MQAGSENGTPTKGSEPSCSETGSDTAMERRFFITGTVRDAEESVVGSVSAIDAAFRKIGATRWFVVESDSCDQTLKRLAELVETMDDFSFVSLGSLQSRLAERTDRIAFCRNRYLE